MGFVWNQGGKAPVTRSPALLGDKVPGSGAARKTTAGQKPRPHWGEQWEEMGSLGAGGSGWQLLAEDEDIGISFRPHT